MKAPSRDRPSSPPEAQELWDLYYRDELSYAGCAQHLGLSRTAVMKRMRKHGILARDKAAALRVGKRHGRSTGPVPRPWTPERLEARSEAAVASVKRWRKRHPGKARAQWRLSKAVQRGSVNRPGACERCAVACTPHGHHSDYSRPFEVEWLCPKCHRGEHRRLSEKARASDRYVS